MAKIEKTFITSYYDIEYKGENYVAQVDQDFNADSFSIQISDEHGALVEDYEVLDRLVDLVFAHYHSEV